MTAAQMVSALQSLVDENSTVAPFYVNAQDYYDALAPAVRNHLVCRVVDQLIPVTQKHDIEGLVMGVE